MGKAIVKVIMSCITATKLTMLWNGDKLDSFTPERELRQGDSLSPYLFVLCMDTLGHTIKEAVRTGKWNAIRAARHTPTVSHLFFADDFILFGEAGVEQAMNMEGVQKELCIQTGQKVNFSKSRI